MSDREIVNPRYKVEYVYVSPDSAIRTEARYIAILLDYEPRYGTANKEKFEVVYRSKEYTNREDAADEVVFYCREYCGCTPEVTDVVEVIPPRDGRLFYGTGYSPFEKEPIHKVFRDPRVDWNT